MTKNGYNILAALAIVAASAVYIATQSETVTLAFIGLAGTIAGRDTKAAD